VVGVCPNCTLLPLRVLATNNLLRDGDLVAGLLWAAERADVILASWSFDPHSYVSPDIHDAIRWAAKEGRGGRGCVIVFSAGNRGGTINGYTPQAMVETLTVGATDELDKRAGYSNTGPGLSLMAPGGVADGYVDELRVARAKLVTADLEGEGGNNPAGDAVKSPGIVDDLAATACFSGTSASAPLVAGAAALILSFEPSLTSREVGWILTESAQPLGSITEYGYGRLDAGAALALTAAGEHCHEVAEICDNEIDDDCDRHIDDDDPDCGAIIVRAFDVPLGAVCTESAECADGYCAAAEGSGLVRACSARCDFDCPSTGACVGLEGMARCHPVCTDDNECKAGYGCTKPAAALVPPGQDIVAVCVPQCSNDSQCHISSCREGLCAGAEDEGRVPPMPPPEGCGCGGAARANVWLGLLCCLWAIARRGRSLRRIDPVFWR